MELNIDKEKLKEIAVQNKIKFIILFGSYANKNYQEDSDIDIAVYFEDKNYDFSSDNFGIYSHLLESLEGVLASGFRRIDLIDLRKSNILLRYEIISKGELLFGDVNDYEDYKAFAFRDYIDAKSLFKLEDLMVERRKELIKSILK